MIVSYEPNPTNLFAAIDPILCEFDFNPIDLFASTSILKVCAFERDPVNSELETNP